MTEQTEYKVLHCRFGDVLLDEDIYYRIRGTEKPRPYHKFKKITRLSWTRNSVRCCFAASRKKIKLARLIMNAGKKELIDHRNRSPLDNRRSNLRLATCRQNSLNKKCTSNTGFYGVSRSLLRGRPRLKVKFEGKRIRRRRKSYSFSAIDTPNNRIVCAFAHDKFVLQTGDEEFAPLNFPCFKYEPFKSILIKENLYAFRETNKTKRTAKKNPVGRQQLLLFALS